MRTWGRVYNNTGGYTWQEVSTDANGNNDAVFVTTLLQCLQLNLGESPFYSQYGIAAQQSVIQQLWPDYSVATTQQQFSQYFANLVITKGSGPTPNYKVNITTNTGVSITATVPQ